MSLNDLWGHTLFNERFESLKGYYLLKYLWRFIKECGGKKSHRDFLWDIEETRIKVVHKNVSQGCKLIKRLKHFFKILQTLHTIKGGLMRPSFNVIHYLMKNLHLHIQRANRKPSPSILVGIKMRSMHIIWGKH